MKYSIKNLLKARWGWCDLRDWSIFSNIQAALLYITTASTITVTNTTTGVILAITGLDKLVICVVLGGLYWALLYAIMFVFSIITCAIIVHGAKMDYPGYRKLYEDSL